MELFNEVKNSSITKIITAFNNSIRTNSPVNRTKLEKEMQSIYEKIVSDIESDVIDRLFIPTSGNKNELLPRISTPIPILPTTVETEWLTEMLNDPRINGMLSVELKSKLTAAIPHDNSTVFWKQMNWNNHEIPSHSYYMEDEYIKIFRCCYDALLQQKLVYYESFDEYGRKYKGTAAPYKLEYSITSNSFNFIMWNEEKKWTFKSNIATITRLDILDEPIPNEVFSKAEAYVEDMRKDDNAIILSLTDKNNALSRCFQLFTSYDKQISTEDNGTFLITIYHRSHFDEEEILQSILSLGSSVTVISPAYFREKVICCIQESYSR